MPISTLFAWLSPSTVGWLIALVVFLLAEAATAGLVSLWFAGGSLAAVVVSLCGGRFLWQFLVFLAVSAALLAALRPLTKKFISPKKEPTNADRVVGREAIVTERIDTLAGTGAVKISGAEWTARTQERLVIEPGETVRILRIEGAKVTVEPVQVPAQQ